MTQLVTQPPRAPFAGDRPRRLVAFFLAAILMPLIAGALIAQNPVYAVALLVLAGAAWLAQRSIVYPVAFGGVPALLIGLYGSNPLPGKAVFAALALWLFLGLGLALAAGAWPSAARERRVLNTPVALVGALTLLLVVRLDHGSYPVTKLELYLLQCLPMLFAGVLIALAPRSFRLWVLIEFGVAAASAILLIYRLRGSTATQLGPDRYSISTTFNPIWVGRSAADGVLIALALTLGTFSRRAALAGYVMLPLLGAALLASGSRGPVVGLLAAMVTLIGLTVADRRMRSQLGRIGAGVALAAAAGALIVPAGAVHRSASFLFGGSGSLSSNGRTELWSKALSLFDSHFFTGVGTGGFASLSPNGEHYPHNILLEAGAELGVLGVTCVALLIYVSLRTAFRACALAPSPQEKVLAALVTSMLVAATVNSMLSGGIEATDSLLLLVGLAYGLYVRHLRGAAQTSVRRPERTGRAAYPVAN